MSNETKKTALPKLRFPEFEDAPEWEEKQLGKVCQVNPTAAELPETFVYVDLESVSSGILLQKKIISKKGAPSRAQRLLQNGDVIFQMVRPYQRNNYFFQSIDSVPYVASTGYAQLRAYESREYLFQYIHLNDFVEKVIAKCTGSSYPAINSSDLARIPVIIPSLVEQQKIAATLSSLDDLITAQNAKLAALQAHKRGLMQGLFPAEGETVPKLRFPEFQEADWVYKNVSTLAKVTTGNKDTQNKVEGGLYPFFVRSQTVERINSFSHDGEAILTSGDGVGVGKNFHYINGKFDFHQRVYCIYDFAKDVSGKFFYLYFAEHFGERVQRLSAKNSVDSVRMSMITEMQICIPSLEEQQKIAECLSYLDTRIAAQSQKIEALNLHKKGLMQSLFPAATESNS